LDIAVVGARDVPSTYGGYETFLTALLPELVVRGHTVTAYVRAGAEDEQSETYRGVRRLPVRSLETKQLSTVSAGITSALSALRSYHDVVLAVNVANAIPLALNRWFRQPVVINTDGQEWIRGKWGRAARSVFKANAMSVGRTSTLTVSDSIEMRRIYMSEFGTDSTVIPYCWTDLPAEENPGQTLHRFGVEERGYIATAGRLVPENRADWIAEAYARASINIPLLVLGTANYDSPVAQELNRLVEEGADIRLVGHIADRAEYRTLVSNAAALVHGHTVGGINPALIEAMGSGALILAIDTPFNREALGNSGLFFQSQDHLLRLLERRLFGTEGADADLRRRAACRAETVFSLADVASAYESVLYQASCAGRRRVTAIPSMWQSEGLLDYS
jgi:glycosyltransferase involved in cell wall biosynthesis